MSDNLFNAEIHDCDLVSRIEEQPEVTREELSDAQSEWEAEQYELEEPEMILEDDLYMIIEDDPYDLLSDPWEDTYDDPADMYEWDCDLHNEF